jgi:hypothetical protein
MTGRALREIIRAFKAMLNSVTFYAAGRDGSRWIDGSPMGISEVEKSWVEESFHQIKINGL